MNAKHRHAGRVGTNARIKLAESRAQLAEMRTEQAKSRTERAEARTESAETRTESAKTRTEQAESRTEQVEAILQRMVEVGSRQELSTPSLKALPFHSSNDEKILLERLTIRQREILQLLADGQNTKQIAAKLKISPKTVEYHRVKFMTSLKIHDVPGLVRFAMRVGLIPTETVILAQPRDIPQGFP